MLSGHKKSNRQTTYDLQIIEVLVKKSNLN